MKYETKLHCHSERSEDSPSDKTLLPEDPLRYLLRKGALRIVILRFAQNDRVSWVVPMGRECSLDPRYFTSFRMKVSLVLFLWACAVARHKRRRPWLLGVALG